MPARKTTKPHDAQMKKRKKVEDLKEGYPLSDGRVAGDPNLVLEVASYLMPSTRGATAAYNSKRKRKDPT